MTKPMEATEAKSAVNIDSSSSEQSFPCDILKRHYETIGIGDVFLQAPPLLPKQYLSPGFATEGLQLPIRSWELIGRIKSTPQDFIVREIAPARRVSSLFADPAEAVADIHPIHPQYFQTAASSTAGSSPSPAENSALDAPIPFSHQSSDKLPTADEVLLEPVFDDGHSSKQGDDDEVVSTCYVENSSNTEPISAPMSPVEALEHLLGLQQLYLMEKPSEILEQLRCLDQIAHQTINANAIKEKLKSDLPLCDNSATSIVSDQIQVKLSPNSSTDNDNSEHAKRRRGDVHRALADAFPMLLSSSQPPDHVLYITVDPTWHGLIPYLYEPVIDLPPLYRFFKQGYQVTITGRSNADHSGRGIRKRQRTDHERNSSHRASVLDQKTDTVDDNHPSAPLLRLRTDLPRSERRIVHEIIATVSKKKLGSSTLSEYALGSSPETTAAIIVHWTKQGERMCMKAHQKLHKLHGNREPCEAKQNDEGKKYTLFVLKKTQREHLSAVLLLAKTLRCRQSDLGFAGMKDMHAVTYQFCTVAGKRPEQVARSRHHFNRLGMDIGTIYPVDWQIRKGNLEGNQFEIVIRDLQQIELNLVRGEGADNRVTETMVPAEETHLFAMVQRIREHGFVNFFGEQRVGVPGDASVVGVRPFDIGKAMLKQDFAAAIDLLMTGRLVLRGSETEKDDIKLCRQTWKESGGDPFATWKKLPRGGALSRERLILHGLKRYGTDNPIMAFKCLHHNDRQLWIHAYQSFVWNCMATERLQRFGTQALEGDLIQPSGVEVPMIVPPGQAGTVNFADVVLPLPGTDVIYPTNEIGRLYHARLMADGITFETAAHEDATAKGGYRRLVAHADHIFCELQKDPASLSSNELVAKLTFNLPKGSYATMLVRELCLTTCTR